MKRSNLIYGILYGLFGVLCLCAAWFLETKLEGILWGLAGVGIGFGVGTVCRYLYWAAPKRREEYAARLENERIEMGDELKMKIRDQAGRYAYVLGLLVICISIIIFGTLDALEVIESSKMLVLYLAGYLVFQIAAGIIIFNRLLKKY